MKTSHAKGIGIGRLVRQNKWILLLSLLFVVFSGRMLFAQTEFSIPLHLQPVEFDQTVDLASWNHFNRVEGLFAGGELTLTVPRIKLATILSAGYAFSQKWPHYHVFGVKKFDGKIEGELGGGYFDHVASSDVWTIGEIENSFAALLLHEDFRNYYGLKGWRGWFQTRLRKSLTTRALFQSALYTSVSKNTDWHLIPNHKSFPPNPAVAEGRENLLRLSGVWDRLNNPIYPTQGLFYQIAFEKALGGSAPVFRKYAALFSTLRLFQPTRGNQRVALLLRGAKTWHAADLPQHQIDFGGLGTLRGFRNKAFPNAVSFFMARATYFFGGDVFSSPLISRIPFSDMVEMGIFAESAKGWFENTHLRCEASPCSPIFQSGAWHSDLGVFFSISGDLVRIDVAHPVGESGSWHVTLRILPKW